MKCQPIQTWQYASVSQVQSGEVQGRHVLITPQGGKVVVDALLMEVWSYAHGRTCQAILEHFSTSRNNPDEVRAALACLIQAGLLDRLLAEEDFANEIHTTEEFKDTPKILTNKYSKKLTSVIIVGHNSLSWLQECLPSLTCQSYTPLEIILVDNASSDGTEAWLTSHYPFIITIQLKQAVSYARAVNLGVKYARGDYFLLLNPDVVLASDAIEQMVDVVSGWKRCAVVAGKLKFLWTPAFLNGLGNRVGPFSWGTDNAIGHLDLGQFDHWCELPSACFGAALIPRIAWNFVGPLDEDFLMYYEDSEWSYRARLYGLTVLAAPKAVFWHAFGGKVPTGQGLNLTPEKLSQIVYGRLRFTLILLNAFCFRFMTNYLLEDVSNFLRYLVTRQWSMCGAYLQGWRHILMKLPGIIRQRKVIQGRRALPDETLFSFQYQMPQGFVWNSLPELTSDIIKQEYLPYLRSAGIRNMPEFNPPNRRPHLLIVSQDIIGSKMAGPGLRYLEMGRVLSRDIDVTIAVPDKTDLQVHGVHLVQYWEDHPGSLQVLVENADIVLVSGYMVEKFPFLENCPARLVVDLYDPFILENLFYYLEEPVESQKRLNQHAISITNQLMRLGDFFICGSERQRDYWLGILTANGRVNPLNFQQDPRLFSLIDVVGIGIPDKPPHSYPIMRGVHPQVPQDAQIVLWGGGIWNWLDPLSLIQAWPQVLVRHPKARLIFLGSRHPNPEVPIHQMAERAAILAAEIGEKDRTILFVEWLPIEEHAAALCEADIGVTLHPPHVETRFSLRTRIMDYFWASLPVLITEGDVISEWVKQYRLGEVVPAMDVAAVVTALDNLLSKSKDTWSEAYEPIRHQFTWSRVVEPLRRYCMSGSYAADRRERHLPSRSSPTLDYGQLFARARFIWREEGKKAFFHRLWRFVQWRLSRP